MGNIDSLVPPDDFDDQLEEITNGAYTSREKFEKNQEKFNPERHKKYLAKRKLERLQKDANIEKLCENVNFNSGSYYENFTKLVSSLTTWEVPENSGETKTPTTEGETGAPAKSASPKKPTNGEEVDVEIDLLTGNAIDASQIIEDDVRLLAKRRLKKALLTGKIEKIVKILEKYNAQILNISENIDPRNPDQNTALHLSCYNFIPPRADIISLLCCRPGLGINKRNAAGYTPLMVLCLQLAEIPEIDTSKLPKNKEKQKEIIENLTKEINKVKVAQESAIMILLHHGADPRMTEPLQNDNCLQICLKRSRSELAYNMLDNCIIATEKIELISHQNSDGANALHLSVCKNAKTMVNIILKMAIDLRDDYEKMKAKEKSEMSAKDLLQKGLQDLENPEKRKDENKMPKSRIAQQIAELKEKDKFFYDILEATDITGKTPYLQAIYSCHFDLVELLANRGCEINIHDNNLRWLSRITCAHTLRRLALKFFTKKGFQNQIF